MMVFSNPSSERRRSILMYIGASLLTLFLLVWIMKLWQADLYVPFNYSSDAVFTQAFIKGIIDNGWLFYNQYTGAPFGAETFDFPVADGMVFLITKFLSLFTQQVGLILNISFLATFILTTITSLYVLRNFGLSRVLSVALSILYSFLPYHFFRGEVHYALSFYFHVPLIIMVVLWIIRRDILLPDSIKNIKNLFKQKKFIVGIFICLLVSSLGIYYAFFSCFFLFIASLITIIQDKKLRGGIIPIVMILIICTGVVINIAPNIIYQYYTGSNELTAQRSPIESELYGLKITQMLLPVSGHRIDILADGKTLYDTQAPLVNENASVSLGIIASIGFITLIMTAIFSVFLDNRKELKLFRQLAALNLSGLLLSTIGGFGTVFALIISPQIRAYNRIIVFIAFFSLFAMGLIVNKVINKLNEKKMSISGNLIIPVVILLIGVCDQTTAYYVPDYTGVKTNYTNDAEFISRIENSIPTGSNIFQLPYVPFPEHPPVNRMIDYDHFRAYLHSKELKWSYGSIKGREGDLWCHTVSQQPTDEMIKTLSLSGFNGIYIDKYGYEENQAITLLNDLSQILNGKPIYSDDNRFAFFSLTNYNNSLKNQYNEENNKLAQDAVLRPLLFSWKNGFSSLEGSSSSNWRWCSDIGELEIDNPSENTRQMEMQMSLASGDPGISTLVISGKDFSDALEISNTSKAYSRSLSILPGKTIIKFSSNAKRVYAPQDPRYLVFRVENFKAIDIIKN